MVRKIEPPNKKAKIPPRAVQRPPVLETPFITDLSRRSWTILHSEGCGNWGLSRIVAISGARGISAVSVDARGSGHTWTISEIRNVSWVYEQENHSVLICEKRTDSHFEANDREWRSGDYLPDDNVHNSNQIDAGNQCCRWSPQHNFVRIINQPNPNLHGVLRSVIDRVWRNVELSEIDSDE